MPSGYNYSIAPLILNPSMVGIPQKVVTGNLYSGDMVISNEAPYVLSVLTTSNSASYTVLPQTSSDPIPLGPGDEVIYVTPTLYLPGAAPSSQVGFQIFPYGAPAGISAYSLARQTSVVSASVRFGYSIQETVTGVASKFQVIDIFNPSNSGLNYIFYSCLAEVSAAVQVTFFIAAGPQINAGSSGGTAQPHDLSNPTSLAVITIGAITFPTNTPITQIAQIQSVPALVPTQLFNNGALAVVHPGQNGFLIAGGAAGSALDGSIDWYEQ